MSKINLFNIVIDNLSMPETLERIISFIDEKKFYFVAPVNTQYINLLRTDKEFHAAHSSADLILADGMVLVGVSRILGCPLKQRISPIDFLIPLFNRAAKNGHSVFLLKGGSKNILKVIVDTLTDLVPHLNIAGYYAPPFDWDINKDKEENDRILKLINKTNPRILIVSLGAPRQEKWIWRNKSKLGSVSVCLAVGAALDFISGTLKRAPRWMQNSGLEWLYRLYQEPRRLWKRYLIGNTFFLYLFAKEALKRFSRFFKRS